MSTEKIRYSAEDLAEAKFASCRDLKDVVATIEANERNRGLVVCGVTVNGLKLTEADEFRLAATLKHDIDFVEVHLEEPSALIASTAQTQLELIREIDRVAQAAANAYRVGDRARAQELLISTLDGCRWFTDALLALKGALRQITPDQGPQDQWKAAEESLRKALKEVVAAVERPDEILLADLLEYELANGLDAWASELTKLSSKG